MLLADNIMSQRPIPPRDQATFHDFEQVLARYRQALVEYKTTGNSSFKMQVDMDKKWLDDYIRWLQTQSATRSRTIQRFITEYQNTNPDLVRMQAQVQRVRDQGPKLQNDLETVREATQKEPEVDYTSYYIKGGLIAGVLGLIAVARVF